MEATAEKGLAVNNGAQSNALMAMIEKAVSDPSFDVAKLEALLTVKERWEKEEARKAFVVALADFKRDAPEVLKSKGVSFKDTSYKHATLDKASAIIGAAASNHGLSHRWKVEQKDGKILVTCLLTHVLGHTEGVTMEAQADTSGSKNAIQAIGSAVTYLERYTLFASYGIAAKDQDDDGKAAAKPGAGREPIQQSRPKGDSPFTFTFVPVEVDEMSGGGDADKKNNGKSVNHKDYIKPWTKWGVKLPDGEYAGTFHEERGPMLVQARDERKAVTLTWKPDGKRRAITELAFA